MNKKILKTIKFRIVDSLFHGWTIYSTSVAFDSWEGTDTSFGTLRSVRFTAHVYQNYGIIIIITLLSYNETTESLTAIPIISS